MKQAENHVDAERSESLESPAISVNDALIVGTGFDGLNTSPFERRAVAGHAESLERGLRLDPRCFFCRGGLPRGSVRAGTGLVLEAARADAESHLLTKEKIEP